MRAGYLWSNLKEKTVFRRQIGSLEFICEKNQLQAIKGEYKCMYTFSYKPFIMIFLKEICHINKIC